MQTLQAVISAPFQTAAVVSLWSHRKSNQILVETAYSVISAGTELAVYAATSVVVTHG